MIKVYTPFSYSFGNVGTVSNFWTPHKEILRGSFFLSSSRYLARQNHGVKFLELMQISPTRQDVICVDRDFDLEVRITWIFTRQPKELYSKESAAS